MNLVMTKTTHWESLRYYFMTILHKSSFNSTEQGYVLFRSIFSLLVIFLTPMFPICFCFIFPAVFEVHRTCWSSAKKAVKEDDAAFEATHAWDVDLPSKHERHFWQKDNKKPVVMDCPKDRPPNEIERGRKDCHSWGDLVSKFHKNDFELLRENRNDVVERSCEGMGLDLKHVWWNLDLR